MAKIIWLNNVKKLCDHGKFTMDDDTKKIYCSLCGKEMSAYSIIKEIVRVKKVKIIEA